MKYVPGRRGEEGITRTDLTFSGARIIVVIKGHYQKIALAISP